MTTPIISKLRLSLLALFLSISLLHFKPSLDQTLTERSDRFVTPSNYIIRFHDYKRAESHRDYLVSNVKSNGWKWIERRNNAVAKFPTDFGLVAIEDAARVLVIEELQRLELVKDVNPDLSYRRGLLSGNKKTERLGKVGAFVDGKKRPGKIFTAMSFEEGENEAVYAAGTSNLSSSWKRQLLMQVVC